MRTIAAAQAVEALIRAYGKLVFHTIYGLTGDWEESQDLTQETFLQALRAIDAAQATSGADFHAKAWLLRIAVNTARMRLRRTHIMRFIPFSRLRAERQDEMGTCIELLSKQTDPVQPAGFGGTATGDPAEVVAERDAVRRTLAQLPEAQRVCLLLSVVGGFSAVEIAHMLDLGEAAVRQRLVRARKQFRQIYAQGSDEAGINSTAPALDEKKTSSDAARHPTEKGRILSAYAAFETAQFVFES